MSTTLKIAIVGASGGIGAALLDQLVDRADVAVIHATYFKSPAGSALGNISNFGNKTSVVWRELDATDDLSVKEWLADVGSIDWVINCVGMLHTQDNKPEKTVRQLDADHFAASMNINCLPTLLLAKYAAAALKGTDNGVFATVSARVGSIEDNQLGGWYSYRASKAALNMALKCLSIEWQRTLKNVRVLALHPGTTESRLSEPFQRNVPEGSLFTAEKTARLLLVQLDAAKNLPTGRFIAYDGQEIPW